jgi:hypothetical protein
MIYLLIYLLGIPIYSLLMYKIIIEIGKQVEFKNHQYTTSKFMFEIAMWPVCMFIILCLIIPYIIFKSIQNQRKI